MKKRIACICLIFFCGFLVRIGLDTLYESRQSGAVPKGHVTEYSDGARVGRELAYAESVSEDDELRQAFAGEYPEAEILLACRQDLTNDGLDDLVVIYTTPVDDEHVTEENRGRHRHTRMTVVIGSEGDCTYTEAIPAPVENQKIQFQDIDQKDEVEFVLQGSKANKVGYGIYRVVDGTLVNLFGEGMEEC